MFIENDNQCPEDAKWLKEGLRKGQWEGLMKGQWEGLRLLREWEWLWLLREWEENVHRDIYGNENWEVYDPS